MNAMDDQSTAENEWFYGQSGKKNGPVSQAQILQLIQSSIINRGTLVWKKGFSDWQKIENTELR